MFNKRLERGYCMSEGLPASVLFLMHEVKKNDLIQLQEVSSKVILIKIKRWVIARSDRSPNHQICVYFKIMTPLSQCCLSHCMKNREEKKEKKMEGRVAEHRCK